MTDEQRAAWRNANTAIQTFVDKIGLDAEKFVAFQIHGVKHTLVSEQSIPSNEG